MFRRLRFETLIIVVFIQTFTHILAYSSLFSMSDGYRESHRRRSIKREEVGQIDGEPIHEFKITNAHGTCATLLEYGAILKAFEFKDKQSESFRDLTHGFGSLDEYITSNNHFFGANVGRFANRIAHGKFKIGKFEYTTATNNEPGGIPCTLHGGIKGFDKVVWKGSIVDDETIQFSYVSSDGEEGFPGNLKVQITYSLNDDNELKWQAEAVTDSETIINVAHHSYWNLSGNPTKSILDHNLQLNAEHYLSTNEGLIPTGNIEEVSDTPMDFTQKKRIGLDIGDDFEALKLANGYDHCWVLKEENQGKIQLAATVEEPATGLVMEIFTDQPGIQFYTSNFLDGSIVGKNGIAYTKHSAFCLETQQFPDSPNQPNFPSCILRPGETYSHTLVHKFSYL